MNTIICAAFNNWELTKVTYESIIRNSREPFRLIIINNGSTDGTQAWMESLGSLPGHSWTPVSGCPNKDAWVTLVQSPVNGGCGIGRNIGARMVQELAKVGAETDYVTFIDNDIVATEGWDTEMIQFMNANPQIGLAGPTTNHAGTPQSLKDPIRKSWSGEHVLPETEDQIAPFAKQFKLQNRGKWFPVPSGFVVIGFVMMIRNSLYKQLAYPDGSLFDEIFKYYGKEDNDLCIRATKAGSKLAYFGGCYVHHWGSKSMGALAAAGVDWGKYWRENDQAFAQKWRVK